MNLDHLKDLLRSATPGPWALGNASCIVTTAKGDDYNFRFIPLLSPFVEGAFDESHDEAYANTQLISLAPTMAKVILDQAMKLKLAEEALEQIAADASVSAGSAKAMYAGWRAIAVERIDIARAALASIRGSRHD